MRDVLGLSRGYGKVNLADVFAVLGIDCDTVCVVKHEIHVLIIGVHALLSKAVCITLVLRVLLERIVIARVVVAVRNANPIAVAVLVLFDRIDVVTNGLDFLEFHCLGVEDRNLLSVGCVMYGKNLVCL